MPSVAPVVPSVKDVFATMGLSLAPLTFILMFFVVGEQSVASHARTVMTVYSPVPFCGANQVTEVVVLVTVPAATKRIPN